jgi:hypothetical protein
MAGRLAVLAAHSPLVNVYNVGKAASGDRSLWVASVRDPNVDAISTTRILILCRQHGDEPVSTEAAMGFLERVASGTAPGVPTALKHTSLYILPMVNPDGADKMTRRSGQGIDLNRDWGRFNGVETQAAYRVFKAVRPQFVIDMHSWDKEDPYRANCLEGPRMATPLSNAVRELDRRARMEVGDGTGQALSEIGYSTGIETTLCHRYMVETLHTPSLLFETTAGMDEGDEFTRRVDLARTMILWLVRDTSANPESWHRLAAAANPPTPRPTFALGDPIGASRISSTPSKAAQIASVTPLQPFRLPRTIWWALGMCAVLVGLTAKRSDPYEAGYVRVDRTIRNGKSVARGVYVASNRSK